MKHLLTILVLLFSLSAFTQDTIKYKESVEGKRFLLGINISPDYCFRTLKNNDGSDLSSSIIDLLNENEVPKLGYTAGLNVCYNLSKMTGLEIGVQYSNKGFAFNNSNLTFGDMIDPRYGFVYQSKDSGRYSIDKFIYNYIYLDIPLRFIFSFGKKKIHIVSSVGITTNVLLKTTQTNVLKYENGDTKRQTQDIENDFNSINITPTISLGIDYKVSNKVNLRMEPTFRYGLLKTTDNPVTSYLWSGGLNLTCYYCFK